MDVPSKTLIFLLPISFLFANFVLYAICRTLRRPKNPSLRNLKIMSSGAGSGSVSIDKKLCIIILGLRTWGGPFASNSDRIGVRWLGPV